MNKYGAQPQEEDGYRFASKAELARYQELRLLDMAGLLRVLEVHPRFLLFVPIWNTDLRKLVGHYTADFRYQVAPDWVDVIEDVKGGKATRTEAYRLRKRMVEATYGVKITEVLR